MSEDPAIRAWCEGVLRTSHAITMDVDLIHNALASTSLSAEKGYQIESALRNIRISAEFFPKALATLGIISPKIMSAACEIVEKIVDSKGDVGDK